MRKKRNFRYTILKNNSYNGIILPSVSLHTNKTQRKTKGEKAYE